MRYKLFDFDKIEKNNFDFLIGTDEAGRGPAAGGVWAAAVCFYDKILKKPFRELNDSKQLTPQKREELYDVIKKYSHNSVVSVGVDVIESINILNASLYAMKCAVENVKMQLESENVIVVVDGNKLIKEYEGTQKYIIKGDGRSAAIAAASILAKVERDRYMQNLHLQYPNYDWQNNKGYLTPKHIDAIKKYGITKYHRRSFLKKMSDECQLSLFS